MDIIADNIGRVGGEGGTESSNYLKSNYVDFNL